MTTLSTLNSEIANTQFLIFLKWWNITKTWEFYCLFFHNTFRFRRELLPRELLKRSMILGHLIKYIGFLHKTQHNNRFRLPKTRIPQPSSETSPIVHVQIGIELGLGRQRGGICVCGVESLFLLSLLFACSFLLRLTLWNCALTHSFGQLFFSVSRSLSLKT